MNCKCHFLFCSFLRKDDSSFNFQCKKKKDESICIPPRQHRPILLPVSRFPCSINLGTCQLGSWGCALLPTVSVRASHTHESESNVTGGKIFGSESF